MAIMCEWDSFFFVFFLKFHNKLKLEPSIKSCLILQLKSVTC
jgi:hypothetical protein